MLSGTSFITRLCLMEFLLNMEQNPPHSW